jgi:hypothetical protein
MVGPAPDKQMPSRPGCVLGVKEERISGKAGICAGSSTRLDLELRTHQMASVWLVQLVLHCLKDQIGVWRRASEGSRQDGEALQIEDLNLKVSVDTKATSLTYTIF